MDEDTQHPSETPQTKCFLCQNSSPTVKCDQCLNLVFCEDCSVSYHSHSRRLNHTTRPLELASEENQNELSGQSQATTQLSSMIFYPCGCIQQWIGPDESGCLKPQPHCLVHNLSNAATQGQNRPPKDNTFVKEDKHVRDESPSKNASIEMWVCEHCTYKNSLDKKICKVCCKTQGFPNEKTSRNAERKLSSYHDEKQKRSSMEDEQPSRKHSDAFHNNSEMEKTPTKTEGGRIKGFKDKLKVFWQNNQSTPGHAIDKSQHNEGQRGYKKKLVSIEEWVEKADKRGFSRSDLTVAVMYDPENPVQWLIDEWPLLIDNVVNHVTNYGCEQPINDVGILSKKEAKSALYLHKYDKDAIDECIMRRQEGFQKLKASENFPADKIVDALSHAEGEVSAAYDYLISMHIRSEDSKSNRKKEQASFQGQKNVRLPTPSSSSSTTTTSSFSAIKPQITPRTSGKINDDHVDDKLPNTSGRKHEVDRTIPANPEPEEKFYDAELPAEDEIDNEQLLHSLSETLRSQPQLTKLVCDMVTVVNQNKLSMTAAKSKPTNNVVEETVAVSTVTTMKPECPPEISEADRKKRIRRLKADGLVSTTNQAEVASYLMDLKFDENDAIAAANACQSVDMSIGYLQQFCELCTQQFPMHKLFSMLNCPHRCCLNCARDHFKKVLEDGDILDAVCPICHEPKLTDEKSAADYFNNLECLLTDLLDRKFHKLLQEKLRKRSAIVDSKSKKSHTSRIRRFMAEGVFTSLVMAEIASQLISMNIEECDAIIAARECSSVDTALTYLQLEECPICMNEFCIGKMITMLNCEHRVCSNCIKEHFSVIIKERNIMEAICPCCQEPKLNDDEIINQYFSNLQILLKNLVDREVYKLFEQKLRDRALMLEPNFHWCQKCGSGFIANPDQNKAVCPDCKVTYCVKCNRQWEDPHQGLSCEQFTQWKIDNDPGFQSAGLEKHLALYGIGCPKCKFRYELAKGGCMHFTCIQCKHQFCSGCGGTFLQAEICRVSPICRTRGFHAHHPRNCLYYLRDWEPRMLLKLLDDNNVKYEIIRSDGVTEHPKKCPVLEQKEKPDGKTMVDASCGREVKEEFSGLCQLHFVEYLVSIINKHGLDPVNLMNLFQLQQELRRNEKVFPKGEDTDEYRNFLVKLILNEIPLQAKGEKAGLKPTD